MLEIDWSQDNREDDIEVYLVDPPKHPKSRLKTGFLKGWKQELNGNSREGTKPFGVSWERLGGLFASSLGQVDEEIKIGIYRVLLDQYFASEKMKHVTVRQRYKALKLVRSL